MESSDKNLKRKKISVKIFRYCIISFLCFFFAIFLQYKGDISYRGDNSSSVKFTINEGDSIPKVAKSLKKLDLIISARSFEFYAKFNSKNNIKSGRYELSQNMTIPEILDKINKGDFLKQYKITFLPGGTVSMAKKVLLASGFNDSEIEKAIAKDYSKDYPKLFEGKPNNTDLEGFFYGETHIFESDVSAETIIRRFLSDFEKKVVELRLSEKFKKQGMSLYEGITLSSIVQKETLADLEDKRMVAGVFYNRIKRGMNLGSDVTYQYIADKLGLKRDFNLDNPYNLRIYTGLTPTPISTPSIDSLKATADPASHEYLFFLSGDDDRTYFGKTESEHDYNIKNFCKKKCLII